MPTAYFCVLYGSQNERQFFSRTSLTDWYKLNLSGFEISGMFT
jgi:hypothetical protein